VIKRVEAFADVAEAPDIHSPGPIPQLELGSSRATFLGRRESKPLAVAAVVNDTNAILGDTQEFGGMTSRHPTITDDDSRALQHFTFTRL